jgi:hypothetical protein
MTFRYLFGSLPALACHFNYFLKLVLTTQAMIFLDCMMMTRYILIFWLKNPAAFRDEFWSLYINLCVVTFSWVSQIVFDVMLGHATYHIYICTGLPPPLIEAERKLSKTISFNNILRVLTLFINVAIFVRIYVFKNKIPPQGNFHPRSNFSWLVGFEKQMLSDFTSNIITAVCMLLIGVSQLQINFVKLSDINHYPHYLYEYFYRMVRVPLMFHLLIIVFYVRNNQLRKTIFREVQSCWSDSYLGQSKWFHCDV